MTRRWWIAPLGLALLAGCDADGNRAVLADEASEEQATTAVKALIQSRFDAFADATEALCDAAPAPDGDGWNAKDDAAAVASMRASWIKARAAYGAVEVPARTLFPELHRRLDTNYDDLLAAGADTFLFDEHGVMGLHAVERILWADAIPANVVDHESALDGYVAAAFPADEHEADELKNELCAHLEHDAEALRDGFRATKLDPITAYAAATQPIEAQLEQLEEAGKGEEESPYAGRSLADLRASLVGAQETYAAFRPWILAKSGGAHTDEEVAKAFAELTAVYAELPGDALPAPPAGWRATDPSGDLLETPFGRLFEATHDAADASVDGTLTFEMVEAGGLLGVIAGS